MDDEAIGAHEIGGIRQVFQPRDREVRFPSARVEGGTAESVEGDDGATCFFRFPGRTGLSAKLRHRVKTAIARACVKESCPELLTGPRGRKPGEPRIGRSFPFTCP